MSSLAPHPVSSPPLPHPPRPLRRGVALLPSLFTVANLGMGWFAIQQSVLALQAAAPAGLLDAAAKAIGWAILLDGLDGRIARMANASSAFGREFDSLADVISFGAAPALLAYVWGLRFLRLDHRWAQGLNGAAQIIIFLFVVAGAARLARFNIASLDSRPSNPGKPGKRYFVGMPIPAAAGAIAAVVHFFASPTFFFATVNTSASLAFLWLALVLALAWLMVSTWRFYSFKEIDLGRRHPYVFMVALAALMAGLWYLSEVVLLGVVVLYVGSALVWRLLYHIHRRRQRLPL
ncbi:MAG TPA: CDP-alcohol phosphatidyltransferase family protein [Terriglobales bacterium]|nr:CDP-alcohol phosphatidyltransferase family protein [Terriglobales bacterium]